MIYLDYSATTPVHDQVLAVFVEASKRYFMNPNSAYPDAQAAKALIDGATERIRSALQAPDYEVIYTSGATEANNLAIKGIAAKQSSKGKHLIMSPFEHSSVTACFGYLQKQGYSVDVVNTLTDGTVDLEDLQSLLRPDTILVSICGVASEFGTIQPLEAIAKIVHSFPNATFHSDMTQAIGKIPVKLSYLDLVTFSAHKIYGLKGIGALLRKEPVKLNPIIHGGKSTTSLRSGTPALGLILSLEKALSLAIMDLTKNYLTVHRHSQLLIQAINQIEGCAINSPINAIPHILNISVLSQPANDLQAYLAAKSIYISTLTACSSGDFRSEAIFRLTRSETKARTSIRISLSHLTTESEIKAFLQAIRSVIQ
jgi:cysteine desulfurase